MIIYMNMNISMFCWNLSFIDFDQILGLKLSISVLCLHLRIIYIILI